MSELFNPKMRFRPLNEIVSDIHDLEHPWLIFPDPCGPLRVLINDKLYRIHLELLED
jgi:hypothetical protein